MSVHKRFTVINDNLTSSDWLSQFMGRSGLAYLVLFGSIITFSVYTWLLTVRSATRIATHTFINPVVAVLVGWAFGGELLTAAMLVATVLIVISVYLVLFRKAATRR